MLLLLLLLLFRVLLLLQLPLLLWLVPRLFRLLLPPISALSVVGRNDNHCHLR
jgi:hypothetical protein